jgi:hypothetical protein
LNVAGMIGEVRDLRPDILAHRDLKYFYGSYAISPRLVCPTQLQFWMEASEFERRDRLVTLQLDSLVRRPFVPLWERLQRILWSRFPVWIKKELLA